MNNNEITRLNELAKIKKTKSLTQSQSAEYDLLKQRYVESIKANLHKQLKEAGIKKKQ